MITLEKARDFANSLEKDDGGFGNDPVHDLAGAIILRDLASQVEALQADAARLDWCAKNSGPFRAEIDKAMEGK